jgi:hypothetical protein
MTTLNERRGKIAETYVSLVTKGNKKIKRRRTCKEKTHVYFNMDN